MGLVRIMGVKEDTRANAKKIVELLPKTNCGKCGYDNCGRFAKAVAEGNASPFGCQENPAAGYRISEVLGIEVPEQEAPKAFIPQMPRAYSAKGIMQAGSGGRRRGRYGPRRGKGRGRFEEASFWNRIKSFFGYR